MVKMRAPLSCSLGHFVEISHVFPGGTGAIIAGLSAWLGKFSADRIAQTQKLAGEIDLDLRKRRIDVYTKSGKQLLFFQSGRVVKTDFRRTLRSSP